MPKKKEVEKKAGKKDKLTDSKVFAWLATFLTIIGVIIAFILRRDDDYVMHYAKQGLVLFVGFAIAGIIQIIPVVGQLCILFVVILWVIVWINALSGEKKSTWIVSELAEKIKI